MIFDIVEHEDATIFVEPIMASYQAWQCLDMLRLAFPNIKAHICCYGSYENAVIFPKQ